MKLSSLIPLLTIVTLVCAAWTSEDYEIFKLRDSIVSDLGEGVTFYSWLGLLGPKSTALEIKKAYRKLSREIHPDKFHSASRKERQKAEERFQRLSLVGNILREKHLKERYDYFLSKGFPKWRDTGYFYSRFRPGIVGTVIFLFLLVSVFHYVAISIGHKQDLKRITRLKEQIKAQAWNNSVVPPTDGSERKVFSPLNGKEFLVTSAGQVSLIDQDEDGNPVYYPVDESEAGPKVGYKDTLIIRLPVWLYNQTIGRVAGTIELKKNIAEKIVEEASQKPKKKKPAKRGEKIELPNGKVIYGRSSGMKKRK